MSFVIKLIESVFGVIFGTGLLLCSFCSIYYIDNFIKSLQSN